MQILINEREKGLEYFFGDFSLFASASSLIHPMSSSDDAREIRMKWDFYSESLSVAPNNDDEHREASKVEILSFSHHMYVHISRHWRWRKKKKKRSKKNTHDVVDDDDDDERASRKEQE